MIEKLMAYLGLDGGEFRSELRKAEKEAAATGKSFERVLGGQVGHHIANSWKEPLIGMGKTFVALFTAEKVKELITETIQWGREIKKASEDAGVSTDFMQGFNSAARKMAADAGGAAAGLEKLTLKLAEAQNGNDEAIKSFRRWGIDIGGKNTEQVFMQMMKLQTAANEHAMFFELMGKNYKDAMDVARMGVEGLQTSIKNSSKLTNEQLEKLTRLSTIHLGIWKAIKTVMASVITAPMDVGKPGGMTDDEYDKRFAELASMRKMSVSDLRNANTFSNWFWGSGLKGEADNEYGFTKGQAKAIIDDIDREIAAEVAKSEAEKNKQELGRQTKEKIAQIEKQTAEIKRKSDLEGLTAQEKITEMMRDRLKLVKEIEKESDPIQRALLEKDLATRDSEIAKTALGAVKSSTPEASRPSLNNLQAMGALSRVADDRAIEQSRRQITLLERSNQLQQRIADAVAKQGVNGGFYVETTRF